jgi:hypothetical protein
MIPILTGLAAGGLHVFSGADHMAALAPIALQDPSKAGIRGALWGLGHGTTILIVAGISLLLRSFVDVDVWSGWAEFAVGFVLLGVGLWAIRRAHSTEIHIHDHAHGGHEHAHIHSHGAEERRHDHAVFGVGALHGMAGTGYLFGVLPALALPLIGSMAYLGAYLTASVGAMSLFAYGLGVVSRISGPIWVRRLMYGSGGLALLVGLIWIVTSWPA